MTDGALRFDLFFEWAGGCLWAANDAARARYPAIPAEDALTLPADLRADLDRMSRRHDTALDWSNPAGPAHWTAEEFRRFDADARDLRDQIAAALGPEFLIAYVVADRDQAMLDATADRGQAGRC